MTNGWAVLNARRAEGNATMESREGKWNAYWPIDHWPVKNKFNGTRSNLKSKTNGGNRSIFCHVERGRMYYGVRELEFITSRRERARL